MNIKKKTTFILDVSLLNEAKEIINQGNYRSLNSFVEEAIKKAVKEEKNKKRLQELEESAKDPLFLKDIEETMTDFSFLDRESFEE